MNGHAVGGGIDLALACDWRIAAQGAKLRFIHNELGYCPPWGGAQRLSRLLGAGVALRLFATCDLLSADEARTTGLVDAVRRARSCWGGPRAWPGRWRVQGREAVSATKALLGETAATGHEPAFAALWDAKRYDAGMSITEEQVFDALRVVEDPELGMDVGRPGPGLRRAGGDEDKVTVTYSLTSMGCPAGAMIQEQMREVVAVDGGRGRGRHRPDLDAALVARDDVGRRQVRARLLGRSPLRAVTTGLSGSPSASTSSSASSMETPAATAAESLW